jgi:aryl-alcohol dehydrogenase-like predicted oxidoreductase
VEELKELVPAGASLTQLALRWILDHESVSTVIAGAKTSDQVGDNAAASELAPLSGATHAAIATLYRERVAPHVHHRW